MAIYGYKEDLNNVGLGVHLFHRKTRKEHFIMVPVFTRKVNPKDIVAIHREQQIYQLHTADEFVWPANMLA